MNESVQRLTEARRDAVEEVTRTIIEQRFAGLVGEADVGKSAILTDALGRVRETGRQVVYLDLDGAWSPNRLAWRWAGELARTVLEPVAHSHLVGLSPGMWPATTRSEVLRLSGQLGPQVAELAEASFPRRGVGTLDALDPVIAATVDLASHQFVALVIDHLEAPRAAGWNSPDVRKLLWRIRARAGQSPNLHVAVCCRPPAQDFAAGPDEAYHLDGRWLTISPPTSLEFSRATGVSLKICDQVTRQSGRHPRATLELLHEVGEHDRAHPPDIAAAIARVVPRHADLARRCTQHARSVHRLGSHLLAAVASGLGPYEASPEMDGSDVSEAMTRLHLNGLVRRIAPREWGTADPRVGWLLGRPPNVTTQDQFIADRLSPISREPTTSSSHSTSRELTPTQRRVLRQLVEGRSNPEIAEVLGVSVSTVKAHLQAIYRALGVGNRAAAVAAVSDDELVG